MRLLNAMYSSKHEMLAIKLKLKLHFRNNLRITFALQLHTMHPSARSIKKTRVHFYFWYFSAEKWGAVCAFSLFFCLFFFAKQSVCNGSVWLSNGTVYCVTCYKMFNCRRYVKLLSRFRLFKDPYHNWANILYKVWTMIIKAVKIKAYLTWYNWQYPHYTYICISLKSKIWELKTEQPFNIYFSDIIIHWPNLWM